MPTAASKNQDVMLLIGQLLSATQAASEGLKNSNAEIQANGKALIAAVKTLELVEETVAELDRLVRTGNGDSIIARLAVLQTVVSDLGTQVGDLEGRVRVVSSLLGSLDETRKRLHAGRVAVWEIAKFAGWVVTSAIALYAVVK